MRITKIKTEVGVCVILTAALTVAIFTVVGFKKTADDLGQIEKAVQVNQNVLKERVK